MSIDEINQQQEDTLATLRVKIQARRDKLNSVIITSSAKEILEVPEVITPENENGEFCLDRYVELANKVDVLYRNYLLRLEELKSDVTSVIKEWEFEKSFKDMAQTFQDMIDEGTKCRFS